MSARKSSSGREAEKSRFRGSGAGADPLPSSRSSPSSSWTHPAPRRATHATGDLPHLLPLLPPSHTLYPELLHRAGHPTSAHPDAPGLGETNVNAEKAKGAEEGSVDLRYEGLELLVTGFSPLCTPLLRGVVGSARRKARWPGGRPNGASSLRRSGQTSWPLIRLPGEEKRGLSQDFLFLFEDPTLPAQAPELLPFLGG